MYLKVAQMYFNIQFWKQCCSVKHGWINFNYVSFESINHTSWNDNSHTPHNLLAAFHCFRVLVFFWDALYIGVSKQLCVYHLYRNVFLAQTRIKSHFGCILLFPKSRNSFQYPQSKRVWKRLSRVVAFIIDLSVSRVRVTRKALSLRCFIAQFHPKHNAFKGVSKQLCV